MFLSPNLPDHYSNILVCGFMGAGKTTLLKALKRTGPKEINYLDLDQVILERGGHSTILRMMRELGEEHFRRIENELLVELMKEGSNLIALGGGALNPKLNEALKKRRDVLVVWLDTSLERCLDNVQKDHKNVRPLMKKGGEYVEKLYRERREVYSVAQVRVEGEKTEQIQEFSLFINELEAKLI